jgi:sensor histidine kinase YesM
MQAFGEKILFDKRYRVLAHILFWVVYLFVFSLASFSDLGKLPAGIETAVIFLPINIFYTYFVLYWLVPGLIKGRYWRFFVYYGLWAVAGMVLNFAYRRYVVIPIRTGLPDPSPLRSGNAYRQIFAVFSFVVLNTIAMFGVFIRMFKYWYIEQQTRTQIEQEKIKAELELLKAQLHPHFLFNTLNNLYTLVLEKSEKAPDMLMRLSAMLSYVLYECREPLVPLISEMKACQDYIALEKERYGERLDVSVNFTGDIDGTMIAPLLFQPFIENAFKHGAAEQIGKIWMAIELSVQKQQLFFRVINSIDPNHPPNAGGGIGIANVRRRLELLYAGMGVLTAEAAEDMYIVSIHINLGLPNAGRRAEHLQYRSNEYTMPDHR